MSSYHLYFTSRSARRPVLLEGQYMGKLSCAGPVGKPHVWYTAYPPARSVLELKGGNAHGKFMASARFLPKGLADSEAQELVLAWIALEGHPKLVEAPRNPAIVWRWRND